MAQLVSREELALVLDEAISAERFNALYSTALRIVRTGYDGDPEAATGRALDVVTGVLQSVLARILTNPKGARTVGLGSANVTFGGQDSDIANVFALTEAERADLTEVSPRPVRSGAFTIMPGRS
ncbi:hypothetical protein JNUCC0626_18180 [Lentzea sp. JNUCC 0626]|uniref:hypothetical protein n=1 Tax=Lentzea sp. JNUCC 0626 TaxID=3367513 RepID=UPI003747EC67